MQSLAIRLVLLCTATLLVACGQRVSTDSNAATGNAGASTAGSTAGSGVAGSTAGAAAISGRGAAGGVGSSATARAADAGGSGASGASAGSVSVAGRPAAVAGSSGSAAGGGGAALAGMGALAGRGGGGAGGAAAGSAAAGSPGTDYAPCPTDGVCKILPLGDSITYGIGYSGGYRVELFRKAHSEGKKISFTGSLSNGPNMVDGVMFPKNNEGHSGWEINQLLPLIPMPALQDPPHIVLLMIGTNDVNLKDDLANAPKRLGGLLDKIAMNAPNALIVVAKLTPLGNSNAVTTYNSAIPAVVQERAAAGKHIVLVDQFTGFPTSQLGDGVHPNQQGYERMAGVWYQAIGKLLH